MVTRLLHLGALHENANDNPWVAQRLAKLTAGQEVSWKQRVGMPDTITEIEWQCRAAKLDGVVCTEEGFLEKLLYAQEDFKPPQGRKQITLDDYQGSLLFTPKERIPVVILNPLYNLITVPWAEPAAKRFVSKLSRAGSWYRATEFTWTLARPDSIECIYQRMLRNAAILGVDIETIRDDPDRRISCICFAAYYPNSHTTEVVVIPFTDMFWWSWVQKFCDLETPKVFQNGLYDNLYLLRWGCPVRNWLHDTQHLFHSMFTEYPKRLDFISAYALRKIRYWKDDGKTGNLQDYYRYNAMDGWATVNSYISLLTEAEPYALRNYQEEFPLVYPALTCEIDGLKVDMQRLSVVKAQKEQEVNNGITEFQQMIAAPGFNVGSWQQMLELFKVLGIRETATGKAHMLRAKATSMFNERILTAATDIKEEAKLLSTYLVPRKFWNGRLHYKINPAGTDTWRLASTESSYWCGLQIQNMPRGDSIKQCLTSDPGWLLAEIDKAQSEARCVGYLSGETKLIEVVEGPHDFHAFNAQQFFGVPYDTIYSDEFHKTINKDLRDLSKRTNHGANYNMGGGVMLDTMGPKYVSKAKVLLRIPGTLRKVCAVLLSRYAETYPRVKKEWYDSVVSEIKLTGRLVSPTGCTRIFFGKPWADKRNLNSAVAHGPQHLSAVILNREWYDFWHCQMYGWMWRGWQQGNGQRIDFDLRGIARLKANIHDSILFQYKKGKKYENLPQQVADTIMNTRIDVTDPFKITRSMYIPVDVSCGKDRWSELK